eukprot:Opistho-1_new@44144
MRRALMPMRPARQNPVGKSLTPLLESPPRPDRGPRFPNTNRHRGTPMTQPRPFKLQCLASATVLLIATHAAQAQDEKKLERVEITGSSIKRIEGETALPVQLIKREDIEKSAVTTAGELLAKISASAGNISE